jgi:hypothetical protein
MQFLQGAISYVAQSLAILGDDCPTLFALDQRDGRKQRQFRNDRPVTASFLTFTFSGSTR